MIRTILSEDDGLALPDVGEWAVRKYRLVNLYAEIFTRSMLGKWDARIYLDLFAGAGKARMTIPHDLVHAIR